MHTILGAGGAIGNELAAVLQQNGQPLRLVSRHPKPFGSAQTQGADLLDATQTREAIRGSEWVYLCPGLPYDLRVWQESWPRIMRNTLDGCAEAGAKLIFFDNVYALGKVAGPMNEETPFNPCSRKGEVRARIARTLLEEVQSGKLQAMIARSADFYGPRCATSVLNILVTDKLTAGNKAQWMLADSFAHSFTYTPDCGQALWLLSQRPEALNQTWNLPTAAPALSGRQLIEMLATLAGVKPVYSVLPKIFLQLGGLFNRQIKELVEMGYQYDRDYIFDSGKFEKAFGFRPTTYEKGLRETLAAYPQKP